jgi:hypothetical protein
MPNYIEQLRGRLFKLGCPITHVRRLTREVADHREDLKQAGLAERLSEMDAEARADASLGNPLVLAEQMMTSVRRSSWWGRHYVITFALLPVVAYPVVWVLFLILEILLVVTRYGWDQKKLHTATTNPVTFHYMFLAFQFADYLGIALATLLFCWLARRTAVKLKWMVISCVICSLLAVIFWVRLAPNLSINVNGNVSTDLASMPWFRGTIPLLVACAFYVFQRWTAKRFEQKVMC